MVVLDRPNRYLGRVRGLRGGPAFAAHIPNPGRMEELLVLGETIGYVIPVRAPRRATRFDLVAVRHGGRTVSIDSRLANRIVRLALPEGLLPGYPRMRWRPEVRFGNCRLDFGRFQDRRLVGLLEVKSSNLRVGSTALFPDAPSTRATRHALTLARAARGGIASGIVFVIQHDRATELRPNHALDPAFAAALTAASRAGVRIGAHALRVTPSGASWGRPVPVVL